MARSKNKQKVKRHRHKQARKRRLKRRKAEAGDFSELSEEEIAEMDILSGVDTDALSDETP